MPPDHPQPAAITHSAFARYYFPSDIIVLAVRCYLRFSLSYLDLEELLVERGVEVDHTSVYRCVQRFTPLLAEAARPCRHGVRWQVDETDVKIAGQWRYVYRAVDEFGQVIDVYVSPRRDANTAGRFRAGHQHDQDPTGGGRHRPGCDLPDRAGRAAPSRVAPRGRYANNRIEADHGRLKARLRPMRGLKQDAAPGPSSSGTRWFRMFAAALRPFVR
jgi:transposase-like protein